MADVQGTLVGVEYVTEKWNRELKQAEPCTPHIALKVMKPDGKPAFIKKYVSEKALPYTQKDLDAIGAGMLLGLLGKKHVLIYGTDKEWNGHQYVEWNIARNQNPAPPAPPTQGAVPPPAEPSPDMFATGGSADEIPY